jgi:hypothetical protein
MYDKGWKSYLVQQNILLIVVAALPVKFPLPCGDKRCVNCYAPLPTTTFCKIWPNLILRSRQHIVPEILARPSVSWKHLANSIRTSGNTFLNVASLAPYFAVSMDHNLLLVLALTSVHYESKSILNLQQVNGMGIPKPRTAEQSADKSQVDLQQRVKPQLPKTESQNQYVRKL